MVSTVVSFHHTSSTLVGDRVLLTPNVSICLAESKFTNFDDSPCPIPDKEGINNRRRNGTSTEKKDHLEVPDSDDSKRRIDNIKCF